MRVPLRATIWIWSMVLVLVASATPVRTTFFHCNHGICLYALGQGTPRDYLKAKEKYEKEAAGGDPEAMRKLGGLYYHGEGVPQNYQKAKEWSEKAAAAGDAVA